MPEKKTFKGSFKNEIMQIAYKIRKVKDVYDKVLKMITCKLRKVLNKIVKNIKSDTKKLNLFENLSQQKARTMKKPGNEPIKLKIIILFYKKLQQNKQIN